MNNDEILNQLYMLDKKYSKAVYMKSELKTVFDKKNDVTLAKTLRAFVEKGHLVRISKGVYLYARHTLSADVLIGHIVNALRPSECNYLSLESVLSEYGIISQVPFRMTFMTTGKEGVFTTPVGTIEFTHTKKSLLQIFPNLITGKDYLRAKPFFAYKELVRVGRNTHLVQQDELDNYQDAKRF